MAHKPKVPRVIIDAIERAGGTLDNVARTLVDNLSATRRKAFITKAGVIYTEPDAHHAVRQRAAEVIIELNTHAQDADEELDGTMTNEFKNPEPKNPALKDWSSTDRMLARSARTKVQKMLELAKLKAAGRTQEVEEA